MKHLKGYRKLGVREDHRRSLLSNLASSFMLSGKIKTTVPKAKEAKRFIERLITLARKNTLHSRRLVAKKLYGHIPQRSLFDKIVPECKSEGGYTRIIRLGKRKGDCADMCLLELVNNPIREKEVSEVNTTDKPELKE